MEKIVTELNLPQDVVVTLFDNGKVLIEQEGEYIGVHLTKEDLVAILAMYDGRVFTSDQ